MNRHSGWIRRPWLAAVVVAAVAFLPAALASAGKGGRGGRPPRHMAPRRPNAMRSQAPRMPRNSNVARPNPAANANANAQARAGTPGRATAGATAAHANANANARGGSASAGNLKGALAATSAIGTVGSALPRSTKYSYGTGSSARQMHSYGYGHGYRNRSGGRASNRSQGNNRALVSRLRSVHTSLARLDHDYRGHRAKAMHSITGAVRTLSHRSTSANANGTGNVRNAALARNGANGNGNRNANANANGGARMNQAQSDQRMGQALRTTQGIQMQMVNQGSNNSSLYAARRHVARATSEMHAALTAR